MDEIQPFNFLASQTEVTIPQGGPMMVLLI
jgi:hypothetical protein